MPLDAADRPRLAAKVRVRVDRVSGQHMLIYPEKGMLLNATSTAIVQRCNGEHSIAAIIEALATQWPTAPRDRIAHEVHAFLEELTLRGLLRFVS